MNKKRFSIVVMGKDGLEDLQDEKKEKEIREEINEFINPIILGPSPMPDFDPVIGSLWLRFEYTIEWDGDLGMSVIER